MNVVPSKVTLSQLEDIYLNQRAITLDRSCRDAEVSVGRGSGLVG